MFRVSVILPVYNVGLYIENTIQSILQQTFKDFELIVLDDCSTDDTVKRVLAFTDSRVKVIVNTHNMGRAGTDNIALEYVSGEYIAKMDGDDICHPERLAQQVAYLDKHPEVNVVGSFMQNFGSSNYLNRYPAHPEDAQVLTLFTLPTGNPSAMLRASLFFEHKMRYDASLRQTEDYEFCARYIRQLRIATIQAPLIKYRVPPHIQKKAVLNERANVSDVVRENLLRRWGIPFTARELQIYNKIAMLQPLQDIQLSEVEAWLYKMVSYNEKFPLFNQNALQRGLGVRWFEVCYGQPLEGFRSMKIYNQSEFSSYASISKRQQLKFLLKSLRSF
ncbi:glycosyltransferase family 2 protein [Hymenobacter sp. BT683]|uniref:Glycosyltransferase family 2 protein n=1 Tax=Hymenobacter jeongseonensis TaxID=2791027 RepID=A0ABS0IEH4_9BACT|nr:glycosyltransferase family A protein [Hymenobacter jeongseonensis]MBF9236754.1 glycosyltransferase family 2 protein [Hymenobacter jeongseonensis]